MPSQKKSENLNTTTNEVEAVIIKLSANKRPGLDGFIGKFYQTFKEKLTSILFKLFQKFQEGRLPSSFYEASTILILKPDKATTKKKIAGQYPQ